jgi:hypothetical protein
MRRRAVLQPNVGQRRDDRSRHTAKQHALNQRMHGEPSLSGELQGYLFLFTIRDVLPQMLQYRLCSGNAGWVQDSSITGSDEGRIGFKSAAMIVWRQAHLRSPRFGDLPAIVECRRLLSFIANQVMAIIPDGGNTWRILNL